MQVWMWRYVAPRTRLLSALARATCARKPRVCTCERMLRPCSARKCSAATWRVPQTRQHVARRARLARRFRRLGTFALKGPSSGPTRRRPLASPRFARLLTQRSVVPLSSTAPPRRLPAWALSAARPCSPSGRCSGSTPTSRRRASASSSVWIACPSASPGGGSGRATCTGTGRTSPTSTTGATCSPGPSACPAPRPRGGGRGRRGPS
mmetsp:Transcript_55328/g.125823  ORF Transcript_55328/g.125823 Transcript_55328/m.125823 type:complete len:208 (+) Transcript_55328:923-1546(+)